MARRRQVETSVRLSLKDREKVLQGLNELARGGDKAAGRLARSLEKPNNALDRTDRKAKRASVAVSAFGASAASSAGPVGALAGRVGGLNTGLGLTATVAIAAGAAIGGIGLAAVSGVRRAAEFERQMFRIEALIKATGGAAGLTSGQILDFARDLDKATLQSKRGILDASGALLTFRSISGDAFKRTLTLAADVSEVFGTDLRSATLQLAKALQDPARNLSQLSRSGITFSKAQIDVIKKLQETNRLAEAQTIIFRELEQQFGGAAAKAASGFAGQLDRAAFELNEALETLGTALLPVVTEGIAGLADAISDPKFQEGARLIGTVLAGALGAVGQALAFATANAELFIAAIALTGGLRVLVPAGAALLAFAGNVLTVAARMGVATAATFAFSRGFAAMSALLLANPFTVAIAGAGLLAAALLTVETNADRTKRAMETVQPAIDGAAKKARELATAAGQASVELRKMSAEAIVAAVTQVTVQIESQRAAIDNLNVKLRNVTGGRTQISGSGGPVAGALRDRIKGEQETLRLLEGQLAKIKALSTDVAFIRRVRNETLKTETEITTAVTKTGKARKELSAGEKELLDRAKDSLKLEEAKRKAAAKLAAEQRKAAEKAAKEFAEPFIKAFDDISGHGRDALANIFKGGKVQVEDFLTFMRNRFADLFAELVERQFLKPIFNAAGNQLAGAFGGQGISGFANSAPSALGGIGRLLSFGGGIGGGSNPTAIIPGAGVASQGINTAAGGSVAGLLGAGASGAGVGSIAGSLVGNGSSQSQIGSSVGGLAGGIIGSFFGPIGTLIGGALGGLGGSFLGGLFSKKSVGPTGNAALGVDLSSGVFRVHGVGADNGADRNAIAAAGAEAVAALNRIRSDLGLSVVSGLPQSSDISLRGNRGTATSPEQSVNRALAAGVFSAGNADLDRIIKLSDVSTLEANLATGRLILDLIGDAQGGLLDVGNTLAEVSRQARTAARDQVDQLLELQSKTAELGFGDRGALVVQKLTEQILAFTDKQEEVSESAKAMAALAAQFDVLRDSADRLGVSVGQIDDAQARALAQLREGFDDGIRLQILAITDPLTVALEDEARRAATRLEDAKALGADLVQVERLNALARAQIVDQFNAQAQQALTPLLQFLEAIEGGTYTEIFGQPSRVASTLAAVNDNFAQLRDNADALGIALARINDAQALALATLVDSFDRDISRQILSITDPLAAALADEAEAAAARLADARLLGANLAEVERLNALKRQEIIRQGATGPDLSRFLEELTFGSISGASPSTGFSGALATFRATAAQALAGDLGAQNRIEDLGRTLLTAARAFNASGPIFGDTLSEVRDVVARISTANDNGQSVVVDAINNTGAEQVGLLVTLVQEVGRLRSELEALRQDEARRAEQDRLTEAA